jgi:hypothetical protein
VLLQKPTTATLFFYGHKAATIDANASAIVSPVATTVTALHIIGGPVYTTHCASIISEQGSGSGHPTGVGHAGGVVRKSS